MFTNFKTPMDFFTQFTDYAKSFPKTEAEIKDMLVKAKNVFEKEAANSKDVWNTYRKMSTGDASMNEINAANKKTQELLKSTRFAFLLALPGTVFLLPAIIKFAEQYDIDLVPSSVSSEFGL
jgi:hypothetical protein